jgi:hypothetical protein
MTRILTALVLFVLAGFFLSPSAQAQLPGIVKVRGEIVSVDAQAASFELKTLSGHVITVQTGAKTRIVVDGKLAKIEDLEAGMRAGIEGRKDPLHKVLRAYRVRAFTPPAP